MYYSHHIEKPREAGSGGRASLLILGRAEYQSEVSKCSATNHQKSIPHTSPKRDGQVRCLSRFGFFSTSLPSSSSTNHPSTCPTAYRRRPSVYPLDTTPTFLTPWSPTAIECNQMPGAQVQPASSASSAHQTTLRPHPPPNALGASSTPTTTATGSGGAKPRTARACSACNRQKLRCDGAKPCARCVAANSADGCEYLPSMRGKTRKRKATATPAPRAPLRPAGPVPLSAPRRPSPARYSPPPLSPVALTDEVVPPKRARVNSGEKRDGTLKPQYAMWHKSSALARYGPRNSAIWADGGSPEPEVGVSPMSVLSGQSARSGDRPTEGLTTLPLPGDLHNPLAVLAQASATAEQRESSDERAQTPPETEERRGYYAPLEHMLKDEAPHIMSLINVHEWVYTLR